MTLEAKNISFSYKSKKVLTDFSVSISKNDFVMLLGANGSGKSTALKILAGFLAPCSGEVCCSGKKLSEMRSFERARKIAVVSQLPPPVLDFTVAEFIMMGRLAHSPRLAPPDKKDREAVKNAMAELDLEPLAERLMYRLSGGERQRVLLAQALAQEPEYLLLDEPTSALDPAHGIALMQVLRRLKNKVGILMICHDLNLAWNYAENVIILNHGKISCSGSTHQVLTAENISANFNCNAVIHPDEGIILK